MKKFYRLEWYLTSEVDYKTKRLSNREIAERQYKELKECLGKGCWISLEEWVEKDEEVGFEFNEQMHFTEIW